ncbi:sporulation histidine kinase inhibitor Sda [Mangrovibacillus cuniculi]|uniref:Sporulation histidine kinase inhibitor Sda n=1 Tax=Mangrovibacillus cuniculi TaxID=2593652 RepID=A0A7S8CAS5_9BACI|nr:sporulation histidine kinase inhibitor Sda [Mangrovibacillus cuniculi]QPC46562.1 sporulation histidine kinase inhibitor Sda [Mangrovibacillus cuniculi]
MKIMSNEQLLSAYREAKKNGDLPEWREVLKKELRMRGIKH